MQAALRSGGTNAHALPVALKAVCACIDSLPPQRSASAAEALCTQHGLMMTVRNGLGPAAGGREALGEELSSGDGQAGSGRRVRALAATLQAVALMLRVGGICSCTPFLPPLAIPSPPERRRCRVAGTCRSTVLLLPLLKRPGILAELLTVRADVRASCSAQAGGCALLRSLLLVSGAQSAVVADGVDVVVTALRAHGEADVDVAREACECVSTFASARALLPALLAAEQLVGLITRALGAHGARDRLMARAACNALRLLCTVPDGAARGGNAPPADDIFEAARAMGEFRAAGGEHAVRQAVRTHGASLKSVAESLLQPREARGEVAAPPKGAAAAASGADAPAAAARKGGARRRQRQ